MKHVLTDRPMFHSDSEELRTKIWATKSTYSDQTRNFEKESSIWSVIWYVQLSLARFGIHVIGSIPKQYKPFWTPRVRLKLIMRWCVQNLSTFNSGTNYRPSQWYQIWPKLWCVWFKKQVIAPSCKPPLLLPLPILGNSDLLGSKRNFGKANFYWSLYVSFHLFFSLKEKFFILNLSRRGKAR